MKTKENIFIKAKKWTKKQMKKAVENKEITVASMAFIGILVQTGTTLYISNRDFNLRQQEKKIFTDINTGVSFELKKKIPYEAQKELETCVLQKNDVSDILEKYNLI